MGLAALVRGVRELPIGSGRVTCAYHFVPACHPFPGLHILSWWGLWSFHAGKRVKLALVPCSDRQGRGCSGLKPLPVHKRVSGILDTYLQPAFACFPPLLCRVDGGSRMVFGC